jgi:hypothetical protein
MASRITSSADSSGLVRFSVPFSSDKISFVCGRSCERPLDNTLTQGDLTMKFETKVFQVKTLPHCWGWQLFAEEKEMSSGFEQTEIMAAIRAMHAIGSMSHITAAMMTGEKLKEIGYTE